MPNQLNALPRGVSDAVARRFSLLGDANLSLMPELGTTLDIETMQEIAYHIGWRTFTAAFGAAPVAAQSLQLQFQNPNTSRVLILLEEISLFSGADDNFIIGFPGILNNPALTTAIPTHGILDGRMKTVAAAQPGGQADLSAKQAAPALGVTGANARAYHVPINTTFFVPMKRPYVLVPGTTIFMEFLTVNITQVFSLQWRERALNDQENSG